MLVLLQNANLVIKDILLLGNWRKNEPFLPSVSFEQKQIINKGSFQAIEGHIVTRRFELTRNNTMPMCCNKDV